VKLFVAKDSFSHKEERSAARHHEKDEAWLRMHTTTGNTVVGGLPRSIPRGLSCSSSCPCVCSKTGLASILLRHYFDGPSATCPRCPFDSLERVYIVPCNLAILHDTPPSLLGVEFHPPTAGYVVRRKTAQKKKLANQSRKGPCTSDRYASMHALRRSTLRHATV
jgi:hypothetical protein